MVLREACVVSYYGMLASLTGGWVPMRSRNWKLIVFHLYVFLSLLLFPLIVYLLDRTRIAGWIFYSLLTCAWFIFLKTLNFRLHKALGSDPVSEPEENNSQGESEEQLKEEQSKGDKSSDVRVETVGKSSPIPVDSSEPVKLLTVTVSGENPDKDKNPELDGSGDCSPGRLQITNFRKEVEEELQRHRSSASTLNDTTPPSCLGHSQEVELHTLEPEEHRAAASLDRSQNANELAVEREEESHDQEKALFINPVGGGDTLMEDIVIKSGLNRRVEVQCEIETPSSPVHRSDPALAKALSEEAPLNGVGREDSDLDSEEEAVEDQDVTGRRQRRCQRTHRLESLSSRLGRQTSEDIETKVPPGSMATSVHRVLRWKAKQLLGIRGYPALEEVAEKMSDELIEEIYKDNITEENYEALNLRVHELRRGHLATSPEDPAPYAIFWYEVNGGWDFYSFNIPPPHDEFSGLDLTLATALQYHLGSDSTPPTSPHLYSHQLSHQNNSPLMWPSHHAANIDTSTSADGSTHPAPPTQPVASLPSIVLIPCIKRTRVTLAFARTKLEEFMDRNVTRREVVLTIVLALLVCIITALLLTVTDFFRDFWAFWLCFVVASCHFSLIKSVQSDPASPTPGLNQITALSRAIYFIAVGVLGLILDAILKNSDSFTPLCVYGYNLNSEPVISFVRDGLFVFILSLPLFFLFGWLPQFNTFIIFFLEQIDIHVFGGTASTGLMCSFYSFGRSLLVTGLLYPLGYAAFRTLESDIVYVGQDCSITYAGFSATNVTINQQCNSAGRVALSFYLGVLFALSYILSRSTSNHQYIWELIQYHWNRCRMRFNKTAQQSSPPIPRDPLDEMYRTVIAKRLLSDFFISVFLFFFVTLLSVTSAFCQSEVGAYVIYGITCLLGVFNYYILPHLRKETPCLCASEPLLKSDEYYEYEVTETPKVTIVEKIMQITIFLEKNIFYLLSFLFAINLTAVYYRAKFGDFLAPLMVTVIGMKLIRSISSDLTRQYMIFILTLLFFNFDYQHLSEGLPLDYFIIAILFNKFFDLYLKLYFIYIYIMPWNGAWSSPLHILIQPFLIPHCPLIFFQTVIGAIVSAPMNPIGASSMFFLSYTRPVKFWEKDYNTKRADTTNTRLEQQLEATSKNPNPDHLDSLFYEHLTWSLQRDLCGDITLGRWGRVSAGDIFILTSDQLNALVHIIEVGNGFVTFQLRGLEFRATFCHQQEREAIVETMAEDNGFCCCSIGHIPHFLSCNKAVLSRWMAWEVISSGYTLHGYSISENQAHLVFNSYDFKKNYITYYVKCMIYLLVKLPRITTLLASDQLRETLAFLHMPDAIELDSLFDPNRNIDYNSQGGGGVSRMAFIHCYHEFIQFCKQKHLSSEIDASEESFLVTLCFALSLLGRRMFFTHAQTGSRRGDNFMHGLYRMFLGDARPHSDRDEWIFHDVDIIQDVIIPASRMALKVHQDNFTFSDQYETPEGVYDAIMDVQDNHIVTHENDRTWRDAVVLNRPSLLALRYQRTEDSYLHPYKIIRLTSKFIKFRVVKINRECVRGLWCSQQHELIYLRNSDSERGSIQNHKATLRNMINSSMDLPIGYPIYVSPLQTSFLDRHTPYNKTFMGQISNPLEYFWFIDVASNWCQACTKKYQGSRGQTRRKGIGLESSTEVTTSPLSPQHRTGSVDSLTGVRYRDQAGDSAASADPLAGDSDSDEDFWKPIWVGKQVVITSVEQVFENFNESWLYWPDKSWCRRANKSHWKSWRPKECLLGEVIHEWRPFHISPTSRSHIDKVILLVKMNDSDNLVLIKEQGVVDI